MGIYEHVGRNGPHIRLRELITNNNLTCHCPTAYTGKKGELWYVRLLPPLEPDHAIYWIVMTTPYVLLGASKTDWIAFLKRAMVGSEGPNDATRLHHLLKYGPEVNYWNEFVFKSYHHHQHDAVFLTYVAHQKCPRAAQEKGTTAWKKKRRVGSFIANRRVKLRKGLLTCT
jgi:hypothetical protein